MDENVSYHWYYNIRDGGNIRFQLFAVLVKGTLITILILTAWWSWIPVMLIMSLLAFPIYSMFTTGYSFTMADGQLMLLGYGPLNKKKLVITNHKDISVSNNEKHCMVSSGDSSIEVDLPSDLMHCFMRDVDIIKKCRNPIDAFQSSE